jgi:hypothetical protein
MRLVMNYGQKPTGEMILIGVAQLIKQPMADMLLLVLRLTWGLHLPGFILGLRMGGLSYQWLKNNFDLLLGKKDQRGL